MTEQQQRKYKTNPHNIRDGLISGHFKFLTEQPVMLIGNSEFINSGTILFMDNDPILSLYIDANRNLEFSLKVYDENDALLMIIEKNVWIYGNPKIWDFKFKYNKLSILNKSRDIAMVIDGSNKYLSIKGSLYKNNARLEVESFTMYHEDKSPSQVISGLCFVGAAMYYTSSDGNLNINKTQEALSRVISAPDREDRIKKGIEVYNTL
ncbi:hypothetical protein AB6735_06455 [Mucilaginibacter sp. RCC_168]|uniref:hypothetical protein n=1 Tax=Mucilaginibacter sp. RCC_168 TaxID=3239221 RepID=UPI00352623A4